MTDSIEFREIEDRVLSIRGQSVLIDRDVAELYGVETREVNQAVKNNPNKFPEGYILKLTDEEQNSLRSKFLTLKNGTGRGQHTKYEPKAFTEKGLYMLATILKSPVATQTTIAIVETFAKMRELAKVVSMLPEAQDELTKNALAKKSAELFGEVLDSSVLEVSGDETTIELNLAIMKIKHTVKREKRCGD